MEVGIGGISVWKFCMLINKILVVFYFEVVRVYLNYIIRDSVFNLGYNLILIWKWLYEVMCLYNCMRVV